MRARCSFLLVLALSLGCNSIGKLRPLNEIDDLNDLARRADALPNHVGFVSVEGTRIAFRHTRRGPDGHTIVLVHGLLSDLRTWRFIAGEIGEEHQLLLVDLMGCGRSDKPDPDDLPPDAYSPTALGEQVLRVIRERTQGRVTLVGHSLGGTIILRMLGAPALRGKYADVLDRVDRAVLFSPVDFAIERVHPAFEQVVDTSDLIAWAAGALGIVEELTARAIIKGTSDPDRMPREEVMRLVDALSDSDSRHAAQAMIVQAIPYTKDRRPDWPGIEALTAEYGNIDKPCLIVWGARDETFSQAMGYKLAAQIPNARLRVLPGRMHQLPGEAPTECARQIRQFVAGAR